MTSHKLELRSADPRSPDATELIQTLSQELAQRYDFADDGSGQFTPADATVPGSGFVVGYVEDQPVACGAFRPLEGAVCEIKRMFVRPEFRGRGYSRAVLGELERLAATAGYAVARLETGNRQAEAIGLYERAGYQRIPNFGAYVGSERSVCFEKALSKCRPIIRPAAPTDFEAILELLKQLWPDQRLDLAKMNVALGTQLTTANHFAFCCELNGTVVGFCTLSIRHSLWQQAGIGYVGELIVHEADRGHGHGKALLDFLADFAAARGCSRLDLDSGFHRTDSHAIYEHCGLIKRAFVFSRPLRLSGQS